MPKGNNIKETKEEDIAILVIMAQEEIASGKVKYYSLEKGKRAEQQKIVRWIIEHSPKWRSASTIEVEKEMRRLGLWEDSAE